MEYEPRNVLILGVPFAGKTYLAGFAAAHVSRDLVVIVHTYADPSYLEHIPRSRTRFVEATSKGYTVTRKLLEETRQGANERYKHYLYVIVKDLSPEEVQRFLDRLSQAVMETQNLALFLDDASVFCSQLSLFEKKYQAFHRLVRGSRHFGIDLTLVTHRVYDIPPTIRCTLNQLVLFRVIESSDLDVLARHLDLGSRAERLATLPNRQFLLVDRTHDSVAGPYTL
jgi:hypothetical protein